MPKLETRKKPTQRVGFLRSIGRHRVVGDDKCRLPRPVKELKGFAKVHLQPGETKAVSLKLDDEAFRFFDPAVRRFVVEPESFTIHVGASVEEIRLTGSITVTE